MGGFSFGIPLSFGGVTITPEQIQNAVATRTGQPAPTLTQAVTQATTPAPAATPKPAYTGTAAMDLTGDPDMDRQILDARSTQDYSINQARTQERIASGELPSDFVYGMPGGKPGVLEIGINDEGVKGPDYQQIAYSTPEEYREAYNLKLSTPTPRESWTINTRPELAMLAGGLLSLAIPGVATGIVGTLFPAAAGASAAAASAGVGGILGGGLAAVQGQDPLTGALSGAVGGGLAGADVGQLFPAASRGAQTALDTGASALSAVSAAGPAVMEAERQDRDTAGFENVPVVDAVVGGVPVIVDRPPTYVEPVPVQEEGGGGATPAPAPAPAPVTPAPAPTGGGMEETAGADPILSNQILEAILAETDPKVRDGLIRSWEDYTGETWDDALVPNYSDREPAEPVGYVWGDGVWAPVFDEVPSGDVIFEPGANKPDYNPDEQEEEVDVFAPPDLVLDTTAPDTVEPTPVEPVTPAPEPAPTPVQEPVKQPAPEPATGADESVAVGGEGTGTGEGSGEGEGDGEGDGSGDGVGAGMMAAAAGAAFEPKWGELFKYTTLTPYQKKTLAPYVDYIAQARGMLS